ncbi:MAG: type II secretion system protein [Pseudomonadales bacterium]|nr:type II secretion system protein [Pseudomonadales bacterium]
MGKLRFTTSGGGYTYPVLLMVTAVTMIAATVTVRVESQLHQREMEKELLFRGMQIQQAIASYYQAGFPRAYPSSIDDLLEDPRFVSLHHLRRAWSDPMSPPNGEWQLIRNAMGRIIGVASKSDRAPIKVAGFGPDLSHFEDAESYQDWIFFFDPLNRQMGLPHRSRSHQERRW